MKLKTHLWTSVAAGGGLWFLTGSGSALIGAIIGGVLIDADHVVDQLWSIRQGAIYMKPANMEAEATRAGIGPSSGKAARSPMGWIKRRKLIRLPLMFHSYELLVIAMVVAAQVRTPLVLGLVTGYALHITLDLIRHHHEFRSRLFYLLLYRLSVGFRRDKLIKPEYL
jgi:hypothetical protein